MYHRHSRSVLALAAAALLLGLGGCSLFQATGTVTGTIYDSTAGGAVLSGVRVLVVGTSRSATTDAYGEFSVTAPEGSATLRFTKTGYSFVDVVVDVTRNQTVALGESVVAYHALTTGQYRFVLTWGVEPYDIDSHLLLPGGTEDVYFGHQLADDSSANLDWDDRVSYGPETITIDTVHSGTYSYSVYNWSGSPAMGPSSNAVVQVYDSTGPVTTQKIVDAPGAGSSSSLWWKVFTFNGTTKQFTWVNQMSDTGP